MAASSPSMQGFSARRPALTSMCRWWGWRVHPRRERATGSSPPTAEYLPTAMQGSSARRPALTSAPVVGMASTPDGSGLLARLRRRRAVCPRRCPRVLRLAGRPASGRSGGGDRGHPRRKRLLVGGHRWRGIRPRRCWVLRLASHNSSEGPHSGDRRHPGRVAGHRPVSADGGLFAHGDAGLFGSQAGTHLNAPVVGMAPTPGGQGYRLVASDGGTFAHGDAGFFGSLAATPLNAPVVAQPLQAPDLSCTRRNPQPSGALHACRQLRRAEVGREQARENHQPCNDKDRARYDVGAPMHPQLDT